MTTVDHAAVFVRVAGDRFAAVERLVCALPRLLGPALAECDLGYRISSRYLVAVLRLAHEAADDRAADRIAYWTARAGGRASSLAAMAEAERRSFDAQFNLCELQATHVAPAALFEASGRLFTDAGAPAGRRRNPTDRPFLGIDVGGPGWEGVTYLPGPRHLFVAAPISPPLGDEIPMVFRVPGMERTVGVTATVAAVRSPAEAAPGKPAGYELSIAGAPAQVLTAVAARAPSAASAFRAAPRYAVKAPVKVIPVGPSPAPEAAPPGAAEGAAAAVAPGAHAVIEYASDSELEADFVSNLSQGGAFIRSGHPSPVGSELTLDLRLPNGSELRARATVAFVDGNGMGVRFTLDGEGDAALQAAIAHISARGRRALVVEDDALTRRMLADALAERGFEVLTAADGQEGLRVISEELLGLDLLLTDIHMPGMDGKALVETIRRAGGESELAIVVVTARLEPGVETVLERAGADAVLDKVLGAELVAQAADAVLERKRGGGAAR